VLAYGVRSCNFCESAEVDSLPDENVSIRSEVTPKAFSHEEWRGELDQRLQAYRAKRRKSAPNVAQSALPFDEQEPVDTHRVAIGLADRQSPAPRTPAADDFAFTIAIGRVSNCLESADPRLLIDVSVPPQLETPEQEANAELPLDAPGSVFAVASLGDRRRALLIDAGCLAFAYGGFLALFGSLGGQFTLSKLTATVCLFSFAFVYIQYFGLFTVFGGSTPGMMVSGIQVASFTGDTPTPRQYLWRAAGYLLSAGTCFLGFLWVLWDEDGLSWHDRISHTYLARIEPIGEDRYGDPSTAR
jgi:uncharacterized RDD family membrane protein YckC